MTIRIELTKQEAELLRDVIEWWAEGYAESEGLTIEMASSIEEMLDITSGYSEQLTVCKDLLTKLPRRESHVDDSG